MAAQAKWSLHSLPYSCSRESMLTALYVSTALLAVVIGVLGLLGVSWPRQVLESWIDIHALFGMLVCGLVLARCRWRIRHSPRMARADVRELSRHLSRSVYLLLFVVIGVRLFIGILNGVWHGGAVDFNSFDGYVRHGAGFAWFDAKDDFQLFLASGLLALILIRVLAFSLRMHCVEYRIPRDGPLA
jgi:cytochrome b561